MAAKLHQVGRICAGIVLLAYITHVLALYLGLRGLNSIWHGFAVLWGQQNLSHDIVVSGARWLIGWSIGAALGVLLGFFTGRSRIGSAFLEGPLVLCRAIPFVSLVPLSVRIFGLNEAGKIAIVAWAS